MMAILSGISSLCRICPDRMLRNDQTGMISSVHIVLRECLFYNLSVRPPLDFDRTEGEAGQVDLRC